MKNILQSGKKTVVDADAIRLLAREETLRQLLHSQVVITPHVAEMAHFLGMQTEQIKQNPIETAKAAALQYGITVILKDARSVITDGKHTFINLSGNNGMATAGSGDVLTGMTAALIGQEPDFLMACALADFIHGYAGDRAAERLSKASMIATDIIEELIHNTKEIEEANSGL